jgi:hypothetical protein
MTGMYEEGKPAGFVMAVVGALVVLLVIMCSLHDLPLQSCYRSCTINPKRPYLRGALV